MSTASLAMPVLIGPNLPVILRRLSVATTFAGQSLLAAAILWTLLAGPGFLADPMPVRHAAAVSAR